jgi:hypothetical protein
MDDRHRLIELFRQFAARGIPFRPLLTIRDFGIETTGSF